MQIMATDLHGERIQGSLADSVGTVEVCIVNSHGHLVEATSRKEFTMPRNEASAQCCRTAL